MLASDFLIQFHKNHFPDGNIEIYSIEVFYKLLEEISKYNEKSELSN
jgi:hypothetical protein